MTNMTQELIDEIKDLWNSSYAIEDIAEELGLDEMDVAKVVLPDWDD